MLTLGLLHTAGAQTPNGGICQFAGYATVTGGLGATPGSGVYRFDGNAPSCPVSSPGWDCSGAKFLSVGTISPSTCAADAHSGKYVVFGSSAVCNVGTVTACPRGTATTGTCADSSKCGTCAGLGIAAGDCKGTEDFCIGSSADTLSGVCAGASCVGGNAARNRAYEINFTDNRDAAVATACGAPVYPAKVYFSGVLGYKQ